MLLQVEGIAAFYGDIQVLWGASFEVAEGQMVALVGSNGAGKTTILKAITGLLPPRAGSITFDGRAIEHLPPHAITDMGVVLVPEGRRLFPLMTVRENLILGSYAPHARAQRQKNLEWVFSLFPLLRQRENQAAGTLSGGEQQMAAIARGLMGGPRLLMLDEPSLGLAPMLVRETFNIVQRIGEQGVTVLLVEQNVRQTLAMADHAYVVENGRVTMSGNGRDLLNDDHVRQAYLGA